VTIETTNGLVTDMARLRESAGLHLGHTDWCELTQATVDRFAELTGDHQFIHVDPARARQTPFGGTIAHGYLTLSLLGPMTQQLLQVTDATMSVNYGLDRVRFPAPLRVGARWRGAAQLAEVSEVPGGLQARLIATVEVQGSDKPAVAAECLVRVYEAIS
jgi:acyl dehydratase